jgi:hypothetical protein
VESHDQNQTPSTFCTNVPYHSPQFEYFFFHLRDYYLICINGKGYQLHNSSFALLDTRGLAGLNKPFGNRNKRYLKIIFNKRKNNDEKFFY